MPTGTGKSLVIALLVNELKMKTLIVVPSLEIKRQLTESLCDIFDMSHITIKNIDSNDLHSAEDYDCLIIDEAHHTAAKTYRLLNKKAWANIYYRFFLTATPFRNDPEEQLLLESIAGEIIYKLSYRDAITNGYIVPVEAYTINIPRRKNDYYGYREVYNELVVKNTARNDKISKIVDVISDKPTLILIREILHGKILSDMTGHPYVGGS